MRNVLVIGYGAIGKSLIAQLDQEEGGYRWAVWARGNGSPRVDAGRPVTRVTSVTEALAFETDLVVECAGHAAVAAIVPGLLAAGLPTLVCSVGVLADTTIADSLHEAAARGKTWLRLPSGAVGGLDYLRAVAHLDEVGVRYVSRKPPSAWHDELLALNIDPDTLEEEHVLFDGSADGAARRYPKNLNVAATVALNGIGMTRTQVSVVVDPAVSANTHELYIESSAGVAEFRFENNPAPDNPKTSLLTSLSVASEVRTFFQGRAS
ncbi:aspartate dehydrogenase [Pigmentiphaga aceris]|uniref:L-aspartate dehydrogenase n=1 Tax=Pigmentiphaga aceris TaxID=1940612 RepID=A0A5C0B5P2_9BURK|nr:aspartate dehydrogenase [Pigmentiphaga aceris]QEI08161.1 aspartate dehydrogenase [Pigmentiphaga aceris]